jgi:hypothetical protein
MTFRAMILGFAGAVLISLLQMVTKIRPNNVVLPFGSVTTILPGIVFLLFLLALINVALKRWRPQSALRSGEMAVIYGISTVAASIAAQDEAQYLFPMYAYFFRASQDERAGPFRQFVPGWMIPQDPAVIEPLYSGHTTFWTVERVTAWAIPFLCWMAWLTALGATLWAWNAILRRRWVEHDKLSFPAIQLPLEM